MECGIGMTEKQKTIVAMIPARSGSKRVPDKNIRLLAGHPLIAGTASGLSSALGLLTGGSFTVIAGNIYAGDYGPIAALIFVCTIGAFLSWVLAISPRFPPTNAPDHQRLRMALPYFEEAG